MKDRLSVHLDNGQPEVREAITILRNGGTASQSGLVGITNAAYDPITGSPKLPETIFNVQSTGNSNIRFSSGPSKFYTSSIELLGNGNTRSSGLIITYNPELDDALIIGPEYGEGGYHCVNPNAQNRNVAYFSLVRASGTEGAEFGHIVLSENGYVGIGVARRPEQDGDGYQYTFTPNAPLTVSYVCDDHRDSGTISMREQASRPLTPSEEATAGIPVDLRSNDFGKIYVKPYSIGGRTQALYFLDDGGYETNLVLSNDLDPTIPEQGLVYGDPFGNTYAGWNTIGIRTGDNDTRHNTFYGWGAGFHLGENGIAECNTLIGYLTGSGLRPTSTYNTIVGCDSLKNYSNANRNIILGDNNLSNNNFTISDPINDTILIGRDLFYNNTPDNGALAIGQGAFPLVIGNVKTDKFFTIAGGYFSVLENNRTEFKITTEYDSFYDRDTVIFDTVDYNINGSQYSIDNLKFNFSNEDGLSQTLFQLDPRGGPLTNTPNYQNPTSTTPYAQLDADLKLRGAIRFQDGTSLSGIAGFEVLPTLGVSGINKKFQSSNNTNYFVLDYSNLDLAGNLSSDIQTDNTFVALQLDGTDSSKIGKMSLQGFAYYVSVGASNITENCNIVITDLENKSLINSSANARSVMIGCDVAFGCSGHYNSIMIGSYAGSNSTVSNPALSTPFNNIFIGPSAGEGSNDTSYAICIGSSAGKNSDDSQECIFIGNSAGLDSDLTRSIGIGKNALRGSTSNTEGGIGNIEIVAGLDDSERFFYNHENLSLNYRLAINKAIAGRTDYRNISIGDARLSPTAPLEVRYDNSVGHLNNPTINGDSVIQSWYCNDTLVAYVNCNGDFIGGTGVGGSGGYNYSNDINAVSGIAIYASGHTLQSVSDNGSTTNNQITINSNFYAVSGSLSGVDFAPLQQTSFPPYKEGRVFYDSENHTLSMYNDESDVSLQIGQETYLRVRNNKSYTIPNGSGVYIDGSHGTGPTVDFAIASGESTSHIIGLATHDISPNSFGYVTTYGVVRNLNTLNFSEGDELFLSAEHSGVLTSISPVSPNYKVPIGHVIRRHSSTGSILVVTGTVKLGGGDVKTLGNIGMSGIAFFESVTPDGNNGILASDANFFYDSANDRVHIGSGGIRFNDGTTQITASIGAGYRTYDNVTSNFYMLSSSDIVFLDTTSNTINVYLPTAIGVGGKEIMIKLIAGSNPGILIPDGSELIDGQSQISINNVYESITLVSNNSNWFIS